MQQKILVILGPTSSGKSDLAVRLAKKFNGEIVSADSRQVYRGFNLASGKITRAEMRGIPHHLLDLVSSKKIFTVTDYQKLAYQKIDNILSRGKLPIICGGTGFYIQSIIDGIVLPEVKNNQMLRKKLQNWSLKKLQEKLKKIDAARFSEIDKNNKVRLIRAIEIASELGKVPKIKSAPKYRAVQIGLTLPKEKLAERIKKRLAMRICKGMIKEIARLHNSGVSWKRLEELGLEARYVSLFLQNKISRVQMIKDLETKIIQYSKRQMTWFKRDKRIVWFEPNNLRQIEDKYKNPSSY